MEPRLYATLNPQLMASQQILVIMRLIAVVGRKMFMQANLIASSGRRYFNVNEHSLFH